LSRAIEIAITDERQIFFAFQCGAGAWFVYNKKKLQLFDIRLYVSFRQRPSLFTGTRP
jgi:hypothetical protein